MADEAATTTPTHTTTTTTKGSFTKRKKSLSDDGSAGNISCDKKRTRKGSVTLYPHHALLLASVVSTTPVSSLPNVTNNTPTLSLNLKKLTQSSQKPQQEQQQQKRRVQERIPRTLSLETTRGCGYWASDASNQRLCKSARNLPTITEE